MTTPFRPKWGNYVYDGDNDMLTIGVLWEAELFVKAYYHAVQAIEKYLKAMALSVIDPIGTIDSSKWRWVRTHNLVHLAARCGPDPFYTDPATIDSLDHLTRYDQATRYSIVDAPVLRGFATADLPGVIALIKKIRMDLPLAVDNYPLGFEVRGLLDISQRDPSWDHWSHLAVEALNRVVQDLRNFVH